MAGPMSRRRFLGTGAAAVAGGSLLHLLVLTRDRDPSGSGAEKGVLEVQGLLQGELPEDGALKVLQVPRWNPSSS